ncbi:MAG: hypothetical protein CMJ81_23910 [Planctomycetaceae bacterium]|nr:hypothetical protein [Planctomycetaceae bacterium]MBP62965.1 hypothetical protein [Planctomycetaceae bacterium]
MSGSGPVYNSGSDINQYLPGINLSEFILWRLVLQNDQHPFRPVAAADRTTPSDEQATNHTQRNKPL